ncbi:MAG: sensor histidine kinase [Microthrixaceae bacterium]|nr:sensor histidine kinase [Microthrixaceae bacterium]
MALETSRRPWAQPRADDPPGPARRDWLFVLVVVVAATVETFTDDRLVWPAVSLATTAGLAFLLPWRRVRPLLVVAASFGTVSVIEVASIVGDVEWDGLDAAAFMLVLPYALARWASGRDVGIGLLVVAVPIALSVVAGDQFGYVLGGTLVVLLAGAIGVAVRYSVELRVEEVEARRSRERAELARELHDTVAHHVSAIAVQAQAGRVVAATSANGALEALEVIEEEASRALEELRSVVGALRDDRTDLRPQQGIGDLSRLERHGGLSGPRVTVTIGGRLDGVRSSVDAACFRLAQEAVTNALRHARHASEVAVRVDGDDDDIHLSVVDDGHGAASSTATATGFGLIGMAERARLLGGTFEAGPRPDGGWAVTATLPRQAATT